MTIRIEPPTIDGLTLTIDGQPVAPTGDLPREIDPGAHEAVAHAPGFLRATARFSVNAGAAAFVALTLTRVSPVAGAHPILGLASTGSDARAPLDPPVDAGSRGGPLPFVLMGVGGALFGAGLSVGIVGAVEASQAPTRDSADASAARVKGVAGDVMGSLGIATAGVGVVLLLVAGHASPSRTGVGGIAARVSGLGVSF